MATRKKDSSRLSQAELRAAGLLVAGLSNTQVAAELGIHPCTVAHWKSNERFLGYMNLLQHDANQMLLKRVVAASTKALDTLERMVEDPNATWMQKLTISTKILQSLQTALGANPGTTP